MDDNPTVTSTTPLDITLSLPKQAIDAALELRWDDAIKINFEIIKTEPNNVDALNRQGRCYFELGEMENAKKYYELALQCDPYNPIAQKNIKIIQSFKKGATNGQKHHLGVAGKISPSLFLQEPGKTKIINLIKVAEPQKLSQAFCGMEVEMVIKNRGITILDDEQSYLGALPDDTAHQLLRLIKGGNKYAAYVRSVKFNGMSVLIRELFRSSRFRNQPSFPEYSTSSSSEIIPTLDTSMNDDENPNEGEEEEEQI
jgi:tetratricopeptide (TPR) repeat protein